MMHLSILQAKIRVPNEIYYCLFGILLTFVAEIGQRFYISKIRYNVFLLIVIS